MADIHRTHGSLAWATIADEDLKSGSGNATDSVQLENMRPLGFTIDLDLAGATDVDLTAECQMPYDSTWRTVVKKSGTAWNTAGSLLTADANLQWTFGDVTGDDLQAIMGAATAFRMVYATTGTPTSDTIVINLLLVPAHTGKQF